MTSTEDTLALDRIGQIALPVHDLASAVAFYRDVLRMPFLFQAPPGLAFFQCGDVRLMLALPENPEQARGASTIYYRVDDIQVSHATLRDRGVTFVDEPHLIARLPDREVWMCFFRDLSENLLGLMSEIPSAP